MKTVLYADVLFLINFGMDLISLWLTFVIVHQSSSAVRLLISSAIGGLYGVLSVVFGITGFLSVVSSVAISFIMIILALVSKPGFAKYVKYTFILWGVGALLGGVTSLLVRFGNGNVEVFRTHNAPFFVLAIAGLFSAILIRALSSFSSSEYCFARISIFGATVDTKLLTDSGNLVREPVSGLPAVFVKKELFESQLAGHIELMCRDYCKAELLPPDLKRRLRLVKADRAEDSRVLPAFIPDEVELKYKKHKKKVKCVLIFDNTYDYAGYDGILPASLLK